MKYITIQTFKVEYEIPSEEAMRFEALLDLGSDELSSYEVDQVFMGEQIIHVTE